MLLKKIIFAFLASAMIQSKVCEAGKKKEKLIQKQEAQNVNQEQSQNQNSSKEETEEKFSYKPSETDIQLFSTFVQMNKKASETEKLFESTSHQLIRNSITNQDPFGLQMAQQFSQIQEEFQKTKNSISTLIMKTLSDISHIKAEKQRRNFKQKNTKRPLEEESIEKKIKKD